jgi:hypothetical protein
VEKEKHIFAILRKNESFFINFFGTNKCILQWDSSRGKNRLKFEKGKIFSLFPSCFTFFSPFASNRTERKFFEKRREKLWIYFGKVFNHKCERSKEIDFEIFRKAFSMKCDQNSIQILFLAENYVFGWEFSNSNFLFESFGQLSVVDLPFRSWFPLSNFKFFLKI